MLISNEASTTTSPIELTNQTNGQTKCALKNYPQTTPERLPQQTDLSSIWQTNLNSIHPLIVHPSVRTSIKCVRAPRNWSALLLAACCLPVPLQGAWFVLLHSSTPPQRPYEQAGGLFLAPHPSLYHGRFPFRLQVFAHLGDRLKTLNYLSTVLPSGQAAACARAVDLYFIYLPSVLSVLQTVTEGNRAA